MNMRADTCVSLSLSEEFAKVLLPQLGYVRSSRSKNKNTLKVAKQCGLFVANVTVNSITQYNNAIANCRLWHFLLYVSATRARVCVCDRKR